MANDAVRSVPDGLSSAKPIEPASPSRPEASIPSAFAAFTVMAESVSPSAIADTIEVLANLPERFRATELGRALLPDCGGRQRQEATNRLMQRWRKMGLAEYSSRGWRLTKGSWAKLQAQAIEARRAETQSGSVHESAVPQGCAQPQVSETPSDTLGEKA